jgi:hypothetical protein
MRVLAGFELHRDAARGVDFRRFLRRAALGPELNDGRPGRFALERLSVLPDDVVGAFRPRLSVEARVEGNRIVRAPFVIELDAFERRVILACDGKRTLAEIARLSLARFEDQNPGEVLRLAATFLAKVSRYEVLCPGTVDT